jgi:hypothetical protein
MDAPADDEDDYDGNGNNVRDWESTRKMLLEYLDHGGNPWEIPEVPRLILISELGLQGSSSSATPSAAAGPDAEEEEQEGGARLMHNMPMSDAPYYAEPVNFQAASPHRTVSRYVS